MNLATVTIGAVVVRFYGVAVLVSSYQCRISPSFHVETALLGVANLQIVRTKSDYNLANEHKYNGLIFKLVVQASLPDCNRNKAHYQNNVASWYH